MINPISLFLDVQPSNSSAYRMYVEQSWNLLQEKSLLENLNASQFFLITQENLKKLVLENVISFLPDDIQKDPDRIITIGSGEQAKHLKNLSNIYNNIIEQGIDRQACIIALGGGVVGDLAGFVASSILRGVQFVQLPTTLLSAVDSSVGGKVAVNVDHGKNMVGAFYQPQLVYFNLCSLNSLPPSEWNCGLAEMAKHAILDESGMLLKQMQVNWRSLRDPGSSFLGQAIRDSASFKASIVARDEREGSVRAILNLGHTTAHALESLTNYNQFSHGEAVSRGLATALILSRILNTLPQSKLEALLEFLALLGLPMDSCGFRAQELLDHMQYDKKAVQGVPRFVLLDQTGKANFGYRVSETEFSKAWQEQIERFD